MEKMGEKGAAIAPNLRSLVHLCRPIRTPTKGIVRERDANVLLVCPDTGRISGLGR
jgi:hypothetical protein